MIDYIMRLTWWQRIAVMLGFGHEDAPDYNEGMPPGYITTKQAAEELGISTQRVLVLIKSKRLPAERIGTVWIIKETDLELVRDRRPGNPKHRKNST